MLLNMNDCCYQESNIHEEMYHRPSMPNIVCLKVIRIIISLRQNDLLNISKTEVKYQNVVKL